MRIDRHFSSVEELQRSLGEHFSDHISDINNLELGYITPGHGARGAQRWMVDEDDIADMYKEYEGRKEVMLWFYSSEKETSKQTKKRSHSPAGSQEQSSKRRPPNVGSSNYSSKLDQVESILEELRKKHEGKLSEEKLRAWAHLIEMKKHSSYDEPPNTPFFGRGKRPSAFSQSPNAGISPCKKLQMRTELIDQLEKWHSLLQDGGITQVQYNELQGKIMKDMDGI